MSLSPKRPVIRLVILIVLVSVIAIITFKSCQQSPQTVDEQVADGKQLAAKYCISCHMLPDPALIDRTSWEQGVLPAMAKNLGIQSYMGQYYADTKSAMPITEWQKIVTYFTRTAPETLTIPKQAVAPLNDWAIFSLQRPSNSDTTKLSRTTLVTFNPNDHLVYSGDAADNLFKWSADLKPTLVHKFDSPVTGAEFFKAEDGANSATVTTIGVLPPNNLAKGKVEVLDLTKNSTTPTHLIADSLLRPVASVAADFNKDGLMDYISCGFGHDNGALYLLQQQPDHSFKTIIISSLAGSEQIIKGDFNNDGWTDVIVLFAQADEGIRMFLNDHKGGFTVQTLLRFPAVYGSSSFQLVDFNHDGKPDILYTCGDNSDFSEILKPYHGIYIFTNQGNWKFKQTYFYHIDGCTKAIAADLDHDGDLDIAAIAFFTDFKAHSEEGFTYMEQTKPNQFTAHQIPVAPYGRWLAMDVADIDQDGYDDIILGNFSIGGRGLRIHERTYSSNWDTHEPLIILKNIAGKMAAKKQTSR